MATGSDRAADIATVIVAGCAVVVTALVIARHQAPAAVAGDGNPVLKVLEEWEHFAHGGHRVGPSNAAITIVEFGDYVCPLCRDAVPHLEAMLRAYPEDVALVYRHLPLNEVSFAAARAAECAADQGRFWEYHDLLFGGSAWQYGDTREHLLAIAAAARLPDISAFVSCIASDDPVATIATDQTIASDARIAGTPTFLVNGQMMRGVLDSIRFDEVYQGLGR
jgi:protein-disulfide isomerase